MMKLDGAKQSQCLSGRGRRTRAEAKWEIGETQQIEFKGKGRPPLFSRIMHEKRSADYCGTVP